MASAVLASGNEPSYGEPKVYSRRLAPSSVNYNPRTSRFKPNSNPNPDSSPSPNFNLNPDNARQILDFSNKPQSWKNGQPSPRSAPLTARNDSSFLSRRTVKESSHGGYVVLNLSAHSRWELKELKKHLISELERVRNLRSLIEARELNSRSSHPASHFFIGCQGGREVARPPPLQWNHHASDSQAGGAAMELEENRASKANQQRQFSKSATGKKSKKFLGQKRGLPFSSGGDPKRRAVVGLHIERLLHSIMRKCGQILTKLMKHRHGWVFNRPVDAARLGLHDYNRIVQRPMDLGTVKSKLDENGYESPLDFAADVRLTFNNALTYNPRGQDVHAMAEVLLRLFEEMFNPAYQKYEAERQKLMAPEKVNLSIWAPPAPVAASRFLPEPMEIARESGSLRTRPTLIEGQMLVVSPPHVPSSTIPGVTSRVAQKPPKPKAKDPNKRLMSFEEKEKLGMNLQDIPPEKMEQVVHIVRKRTHLEQDGDEIELVLDALDNETLWELDRFVSYHKKAENRLKKQALFGNSVPTETEQIRKSPIGEPLEVINQKSKKGDAGEEDVDIGEEIPANNFPPVEIEKDAACASRSGSSGSSSSSSDSSSSDSDSGSDSDEESVQSPYVDSREEAPVNLD